MVLEKDTIELVEKMLKGEEPGPLNTEDLKVLKEKAWEYFEVFGVVDSKYWRNRVTVLFYYGPGCRCCGESHPHFLAIDHVHGDGALRRAVNKNEKNITSYLIQKRMPEGYRVLCHNCNTAMKQGQPCPHKFKGQFKKKPLQKNSMEKKIVASVKKLENRVRKEKGKALVPTIIKSILQEDKIEKEVTTSISSLSFEESERAKFLDGIRKEWESMEKRFYEEFIQEVKGGGKKGGLEWE